MSDSATPQPGFSRARLLRLFAVIALFGAATSLAPLYFHFTQKNQLERILARGTLIVATTNSATTYYEGEDGPNGLDYELLAAFAAELGVELQPVIVEQFQDILPMVEQGKVDLAAAGLSITWGRRQRVRFSTPYQEVHSQLIYHNSTPRPKSGEELVGKRIAVIKGSHHEVLLNALKAKYPALEWELYDDGSQEELLGQVWRKEIDYTLANSNVVSLNQRYYPELRVAFNLSQAKQLGWAFRRLADNSLYDRALAFFAKAQSSGLLTELQERYYGHVESFDYVDIRRFMRHITSRLPLYRPLFEEAASLYNIDWRLLAAIAYQESHWNSEAVSPTGVKGLMMLTLKTATQMEVQNRLDPKESILGGSRYIAHQLERIPEEIPNPDRIWMALASYNVGYGHLSDARQITTQRGGNADRWIDIKESLPLLRERRWYSKTAYGYARGNEAVHYVHNIRQYYDVLAWLSDKEKVEPEGPQQPPEHYHPQTIAEAPQAQSDNAVLLGAILSPL